MTAETPLKSRTTTLLLCALGFIFPGGIHYFYHKRIGWGLLYLFTFGLCGIGTIVDFIRILNGSFPGIEPPPVASIEEPTSAANKTMLAVLMLFSAISLMCIGFVLVNSLRLLTAFVAALAYVMYWILVFGTIGFAYLIFPEGAPQLPAFAYSPLSLPAVILGFLAAVLLFVCLFRGVEQARSVYAAVALVFMPLIAIAGLLVTPLLCMAYLLVPFQVWALYSEPMNTWIYRRRWIVNTPK